MTRYFRALCSIASSCPVRHLLLIMRIPVLTPMSAIELIALEKSYTTGFLRKTRKQALHPLTLTVEEGDVFGYLGPNGAGKTTTLKLLMGLIFPSRGTARILGHEASDPGVKSQIGFLPEQPYFYDYLTPRELLTYYSKLSGVPAKEQNGRVNEVLARVGMAENAGTQLRKFSKGMLQRVGLAQAIVHNPKLVFLDEPMSGLDPIGRREVRDLIQSLKDEGKTIFFSTHILSDAETLCDRVAVLNRGELRGVGVVADLTSRFTGKFEVIWNGAAVAHRLSASGMDVHLTADTARCVVAEERLDQVLDPVRQSADARLISVNPVRSTLEDYFVERLNAPAEVAQ
jgi:ABC-2 type transport system ATP-binding protein